MARTHGVELTESERFWARVDVEGDCVVWTGGLNNGGYGQFTSKDRRLVMAHRFAYEQEHGPIPEGLTLDHLCRNRRCVNPVHLEAVTMRENLLRGNGWSGMRHRQTHCLRGHEFSVSNTYWFRGRNCRQCRIDRQAVRKASLLSSSGGDKE